MEEEKARRCNMGGVQGKCIYQGFQRQCWEYDILSEHFEYDALNAQSIILSVHQAESMILSVHAESIILSAPTAGSMILSARAESAILPVHQAKSMIISVPFGCILTPTVIVVATKKTICNTDVHRFTTLVNSASTVPTIGLPLKGAEFCHTLNIFLVKCWCRCALLQLYFNSSVAGCWSTNNKGVRALGGFPPKG